MTTPQANEQAIGEFTGRVLNDTSSAATVLMAALGDRLGLPETTPRRLAEDAGFTAVRRVEMENPFNNLYELRP